MKFANLIAIILTTQISYAFDTLPEYQTTVDQKPTSFNLSKIDSEYSSHLLNYSMPLHLENSKNSLVMSIGSLSGKEFLIQQKLHVHKDLNEYVPFRFFWWQDGDREKDAEQFLWSLGFKPTKRTQVNGIGNSFNNKARNDVGLEINFAQSDEASWKFVYYKPDFQKNKRNLSTDRWGTSPQMFFLGYENQSLDLFVRHEPENDSFDTVSTDTSDIAKNTLGLTWRSENAVLQFQYDHIDETVNTVETELQRIMSRYYHWLDCGDHKIRAGLAYFSWQYDQGQKFANFNDVVPNIQMDYGSFTYSYDVTFRHSTGDSTLSEYADKDEIENRFVAKWNAVTSENSLFALTFTFDLDNLEDEPWEGGAANLRINF